MWKGTTGRRGGKESSSRVEADEQVGYHTHTSNVFALACHPRRHYLDLLMSTRVEYAWAVLKRVLRPSLCTGPAMPLRRLPVAWSADVALAVH